jgi:hypothetical protein
MAGITTLASDSRCDLSLFFCQKEPSIFQNVLKKLMIRSAAVGVGGAVVAGAAALKAFGRGGSGQLGNGASRDSASPVPVAPGSAEP